VDWRVAGLIALALIAYWPTCSALWHYWTDDVSFGGHGLLIAALALWMLWRARGRVASAPLRAQPWALLPLLACSLASLIFWKASIEGLQFLMLPPLILLAVLSAFGAAVARNLAVPVGFLYFAMPVWNLLAAPLQSLTLWIVRLSAPLIGVPATVSGSLIALPDDMKFNVGLVCSGAGFLAQGLAVAALLGELEQASLARRLRLLGAMAVIALLTNWLRVLTIVHVGYATGMRHVLVTRHHLLFGYVLFVLVLVLFVWIARQRSPDVPLVVAAAPGARRQARAAYLAALVTLAAPPLLAVLLGLAAGAAPARALRLPAGRAAWNGPLAAVDETWRPVFVGAHDEWRAAYRDPAGHAVEVIAIGYPAQAQDRELVNEGNSLVGNGELTLLGSARASGGGQPLREDLVADERAGRSLIWSFYVIGGRPFVTPLWAQLWYGWHAFGAPPYSALFAFRSACAPSCAAARAVLADFTQVMRPGLFAATTQGLSPQQDGAPAMLAARPDKH